MANGECDPAVVVERVLQSFEAQLGGRPVKVSVPSQRLVAVRVPVGAVADSTATGAAIAAVIVAPIVAIVETEAGAVSRVAGSPTKIIAIAPVSLASRAGKLGHFSPVLR